jgi:hypothetical protein
MKTFDRMCRYIAFLTMTIGAVGCSAQQTPLTETPSAKPSARPVQAIAPTSGAQCSARVTSSERRAAILADWRLEQPKLTESIQKNLAAGNPYVLYLVQQRTAPLLKYAGYYGDIELLEALAGVYKTSVAPELLVPQKAYVFAYAPSPRTVKDIQPTRFWMTKPAVDETAGVEHVLASSQFLYSNARLINDIVRLPAGMQSATMREYVFAMAPVLRDHATRWVLGRPNEPGIFQVAGWGCNRETFTHQGFVTRLKEKTLDTDLVKVSRTTPFVRLNEETPHCNAISDTDLWILALTVELLGADQAAPEQIRLTADERNQLHDYVRAGLALVDSRLQFYQESTGLEVGFDEGAWDQHPEYKYTGDTDVSFPGWNDTAQKQPVRQPTQAKGVGWDIGHASRWIYVFDTFVRHAAYFQARASDKQTVRGIAHRFARRSIVDVNGQTKVRTFMDGANGWYRVNYSDRSGYGIEPFGLTQYVGTAGYAFWTQYEPSLPEALARAGGDNNVKTPEQRLQWLPSIEPYETTPIDRCPTGKDSR